MTVTDLKATAHISQSQVKTFILCPQKFRFIYRDKIPAPFVPSSLVLGSAMHEAIAEFYQMHLRHERRSACHILGLLEGRGGDE